MPYNSWPETSRYLKMLVSEPNHVKRQRWRVGIDECQLEGRWTYRNSIPLGTEILPIFLSGLPYGSRFIILLTCQDLQGWEVGQDGRRLHPTPSITAKQCIPQTTFYVWLRRLLQKILAVDSRFSGSSSFRTSQWKYEISRVLKVVDGCRDTQTTVTWDLRRRRYHKRRHQSKA